MTTKDYKRIAEVFRARVDHIAQNDPALLSDACDFAAATARRNTVSSLVIGMADMLQADNPRFDRGTFFVACGFDGAGGWR